jgi:hypothetical protein
MQTTTRVQMSRKPGARIPAGAVKVARISKWGNPYKVADYGREPAIELYRNCRLPDPGGCGLGTVKPARRSSARRFQGGRSSAG